MINTKYNTSKIFIFVIILLSLIFGKLYLSYSTNPVYPEITQETTELITRHAKRIPGVIGMQISSINLQKNTRYVIYSYFSNMYVNEIYTNFSKNSLSKEMPFFTRDNDTINSHLVRLINHEFICVPYHNTIMHKFMPLAENDIKFVCSMAIPPSFGLFYGSVDIYLSKEPETKDSLITISKDISNHLIDEIHTHP